MKRTKIFAAVSSTVVASSILLSTGVVNAAPVTEESTPSATTTANSGKSKTTKSTVSLDSFKGVKRIGVIATVKPEDKVWSNAAQLMLGEKGVKPITPKSDDTGTLLEKVQKVQKATPQVWFIKPDVKEMKDPSIVDSIFKEIGSESPVIWVNDDTSKELDGTNKAFIEKVTNKIKSDYNNGLVINTSEITKEKLEKEFNVKSISNELMPKAVLAAVLKKIDPASVTNDNSNKSNSTSSSNSNDSNNNNQTSSQSGKTIDAKPRGVDPKKVAGPLVQEAPKSERSSTSTPDSSSSTTSTSAATTTSSSSTTESSPSTSSSATTSASPTTSTNPSAVKNSGSNTSTVDLSKIESAVKPLTSKSGMKIGVSVGDGSKEIVSGDKTPVYSASTIKVPIAMAVLKNLKQDEKVQVANVVGGTGGKIQQGSYPVSELLKEMIENSDNTATNALIDKLGGFDKVNEITKTIGANDFKLSNKMMSGNNTSTITAESAVKVLEDILKSSQGQKGVLSKEQATVLIEHMKNQRHRTKLPKKIPSASVANKTGENTGFSHDIGFITNNGKTVAVAVTTAGSSADSGGADAISDIGKAVYDNIK